MLVLNRIPLDQVTIGTTVCDMHDGGINPFRLPERYAAYWRVLSSVTLPLDGEISFHGWIDARIRAMQGDSTSYRYINKMLVIVGIQYLTEKKIFVAAWQYDSLRCGLVELEPS